MIDFEAQRQQMVDCQIRPNDVTNLDIIAAFSAVPREQFVPHGRRSLAYIDADVPLEIEGDERFLMAVTPFAKMLQVAGINDKSVVLCLGSGAGYGVSVVARLAGSVVATDPNQDLVDRSSETMSEMGIDNVAVIKSEIAEGCPTEAPFDVIFIEGAVHEVPEALFSQLRDGGRLVTVIGEGLSGQIKVFTKSASDVSVMRFGNVSVPLLPGFELSESFAF